MKGFLETAAAKFSWIRNFNLFNFALKLISVLNNSKKFIIIIFLIVTYYLYKFNTETLTTIRLVRNFIVAIISKFWINV